MVILIVYFEVYDTESIGGVSNHILTLSATEIKILKNNPVKIRIDEIIDYTTWVYIVVVVVVAVSHIQRIGCQPEKNYFIYTMANPARGLLNREKKKKEKVW